MQEKWGRKPTYLNKDGQNFLNLIKNINAQIRYPQNDRGKQNKIKPKTSNKKVHTQVHESQTTKNKEENRIKSQRKKDSLHMKEPRYFSLGKILTRAQQRNLFQRLKRKHR